MRLGNGHSSSIFCDRRNLDVSKIPFNANQPDARGLYLYVRGASSQGWKTVARRGRLNAVKRVVIRARARSNPFGVERADTPQACGTGSAVSGRLRFRDVNGCRSRSGGQGGTGLTVKASTTAKELRSMTVRPNSRWPAPTRRLPQSACFRGGLAAKSWRCAWYESRRRG